MSAIVELPGWFVDAVIFDDLGLGVGAAYFVVLNRNPEDGETQIRRDASPQFDIATHATDTPSTVTLKVYLTRGAAAEVLAYDGGAGGFQAGYTGSTSSPDSRTRRLVLNPTTDFNSLETITVRIEATSVGGQSLFASWSFQVEDLTAPIVESATARAKKVVRIQFDEPMNMEDATEAASALNPANYAFERLTTPAVNIAAESVAMVSTSAVDVTLDIEMTAGATYRVTVTNAEDLFGNEIQAPDNDAEFVGYACPAPDARRFDLYRFLPQKNRDEDTSRDLFKFVGCLQEVAGLLLCMIDEWTDIIDPDKAPEAFVDAMLADLGNPFDFDLTLEDKRRLIRILVAIYQQKGTAVGIINAVRFFLGIEVTITSFSAEGWDLGEDELGIDTILGPGTSFGLYSFVIVSPVLLTEEQRERIREIANYMKPAHTHLVDIEEPPAVETIDHVELGLSELGGDEWILH